MGFIVVSWDNPEKTIIRWTFPEMWDWDSFYRALQTSRALTREVSHVVDFLVDMRETVTIPRNVFTHAQTTTQTSPLNVGVAVVVGVNPLLRAAFNAFAQIYKGATNSRVSKIQIVSLEHKAYQIIQDHQSRREISPQ